MAGLGAVREDLRDFGRAAVIDDAENDPGVDQVALIEDALPAVTPACRNAPRPKRAG